MKRLLIVRHGQKTETGNFDPSHRKKLPLTRLGVNQMRSLGVYLKQLSESKNFVYSSIVSSDFVRANQSAQILSEILNVDPIITDARLRERVLFQLVCEDEQKRQHTNLRNHFRKKNLPNHSRRDLAGYHS